MKVTATNTLGWGVKPTRRALVLAIKLTTGCDLHHEANKVFTLFDKWIKNEGKRSAVLRLKNIYQIVLNRSLGQESFQPPFVATSQGFPRSVSYLEKYCTSPEGIQAVLSLLGYWRIVRAPGVPDLSSITELGPDIPSSLCSEIQKEIPVSWKIQLDLLPKVTHYYTSRFGPNGRSLKTCLSDLKALQREPNLIGSLRRILELQESHDFLKYFDELCNAVTLDDTPNMVHSRLSVKQELGGKDRVFAIMDYFTQCTLRPLHNRIAEVLRGIPQDVTWNQDYAASYIKKWTSGDEPVFSFDLTAATDRVPIQLQRAVLETLTGSAEYADSWVDLMVNRNFKFRKFSEIRYSVGQPMGAYSSWPAFAITHHLIVMVAAKRAKISHPEYFLLGDDICMRGIALSQEYLRILETLGVKISQHKTVTGKVAEFAKRIFYQGREISPVPVRLVSSCLEDSRLLPTLRTRLLVGSSRAAMLLASPNSTPSSLLDLPDFLELLPEDTVDQARVLLSVPSRERSGLRPLLTIVGKVDLESTVSERDWTICSTWSKYKYLLQRYSSEQVRLNRIGILKAFAFGKPSAEDEIYLAERPGLDTGHQNLHPLNLAVDSAIESTQKASEALDKYWTVLAKRGFEAEMPIPNLLDLSVLERSYQKRLKGEATITLLAFKLFTEFVELKEKSPQLSIGDFLRQKGSLPFGHWITEDR